MAKTRDYMDYLDESIEIAPANSQEEYQAAQTIAEVMRDHGLETSVEEFEASSWSTIFPHILLILAVIALVACGLTEGVVHVVTLVVGIACVGLVLFSHFVFNLFENFGPTVRSQNVVGIHRASGSKIVKGARPIVIVAHYDTPRENFLWKGGLARQQALLRRMSVPCTIVLAVCMLFQALGFVPQIARMFVWVVGLIASIPLILLGVSDIAERFSSCTIGANNNKASVAALLSLANVVRPQQDRVDGQDESRPVRRRASDPVEPARSEPVTRTVVEEVKGVRHGRDTLMALGILPPSCEVMYEEPKVRVVEDLPEPEEPEPTPEPVRADEVDAYNEDVDFDIDDLEEGSEDYDEDEPEEEAEPQGDTEDDLDDYDEDYEEEDYDEEDYDEDFFEDEAEESEGETEEEPESPEDVEDDLDDYDEEDDYDEDYDDEEEWLDDYDDEDSRTADATKFGGSSWFADKIAGIRDFFSGRKKGDGNIEIARGADRTAADEDDDLEEYEEDDEWFDDDLEDEYEVEDYLDDEEEPDEDALEEGTSEDDTSDEDYDYDFEADEEAEAEESDVEALDDEDEYEYVEYIEYVEYEYVDDDDLEEYDEDLEEDAYEGYERFARIDEDENANPVPLTAPAPVLADIPVMGEQEDDSEEEAQDSGELIDEETQEPLEYKKAPASLDSLPMIELEEEGDSQSLEEEDASIEGDSSYEDVAEDQQGWDSEEIYEDDQEYDEEIYEYEYEDDDLPEDELGDSDDGEYDEDEYEYAEDELEDDIEDEFIEDELSEGGQYGSSDYDDTYSDLYEQDSVDTLAEEEDQYIEEEDVDPYAYATAGSSFGQRLKGMFRRMRGADQGSFISEEEEDTEVYEDSYEDDYDTYEPEAEEEGQNPYEDESYDDEPYEEDDSEYDYADDEEDLEEEYEEYYDEEEDSEWYDYEEDVEEIADDDLDAEMVEEPEQLEDPDLLHFDRVEDEDIVPRDTTGLDTYTEPYDLYPSQDAEEEVRRRPEAMDDPTWGTASYQPARPVMNIARRAALFDLPDPSKAVFDPLESEYDDDDDYEDADDSRTNGWKGGAAVRSDLRNDEESDEPLVIEADDLQDAILELGDDYLLGHDIWFVATGASAYDHAGIKSFVDEHRRDFRGCFLINLESIGSGDLAILTREGYHAPRRADRRIVRMITDIARDLHISIQQYAYNWDETEAATPMRARVRATTIMGMDDKGLPAYRHTSDDVPENIDANQVSAVVRIVSELIRRS